MGTSGWLEQATAWIHSQIAEHGMQIVSPVEILHQRPWATFARVNTDNGTVYFKAPAPPFFEAPLTQALARWRPDCTVSLLAVDLDRGWVLSADAGVALSSVSHPPDQIEHWLKLLLFYVELQIEMADHVPELLELGIYDRRLAMLPHLFTQLMDATEDIRIDMEPGITSEEYRRLHKLGSRFAAGASNWLVMGCPKRLRTKKSMMRMF
jgi:hypothetical protein